MSEVCENCIFYDRIDPIKGFCVIHTMDAFYKGTCNHWRAKP